MWSAHRRTATTRRCWPTLDLLRGLGRLLEHVTVHLDRGYDSSKTCVELTARSMHGAIAEKGKPAPIQAGMRWVVERTNEVDLGRDVGELETDVVQLRQALLAVGWVDAAACHHREQYTH